MVLMKNRGISSLLTNVTLILIVVVSVVIIGALVINLASVGDDSLKVSECNLMYPDKGQAYYDCLVKNFGQERASEMYDPNEDVVSDPGIQPGITGSVLYNIGYNSSNCTTSIRDGLVGHYCFSYSAWDSSDYYNYGEEKNGVSYESMQNGNVYASFDGVDDYVFVENSDSLSIKEGTYSFWIKSESLKGYKIIFNKETTLWKKYDELGNVGNTYGHPRADALGYNILAGSIGYIYFQRNISDSLGVGYFISDLKKPDGSVYQAIGNYPTRVDGIVSQGYVSLDSLNVNYDMKYDYYSSNEGIINRNRLERSNGKYSLNLMNGDKLGSSLIYNSINILDYNKNNAWNHVVLTNNLNQMNYYLNGEKVYSGEVKEAAFDWLYNSMYVGASSAKNLSVYDPFYGSLDNLRIYNRVLTDNDVLAIYNEEKSGFVKVLLMCHNGCVSNNACVAYNYRDETNDKYCSDSTLKMENMKNSAEDICYSNSECLSNMCNIEGKCVLQETITAAGGVEEYCRAEVSSGQGAQFQIISKLIPKFSIGDSPEVYTESATFRESAWVQADEVDMQWDVEYSSPKIKKITDGPIIDEMDNVWYKYSVYVPVDRAPTQTPPSLLVEGWVKQEDLIGGEGEYENTLSIVNLGYDYKVEDIILVPAKEGVISRDIRYVVSMVDNEGGIISLYSLDDPESALPSTKLSNWIEGSSSIPVREVSGNVNIKFVNGYSWIHEVNGREVFEGSNIITEIVDSTYNPPVGVLTDLTSQEFASLRDLDEDHYYFPKFEGSKDTYSTRLPGYRGGVFYNGKYYRIDTIYNCDWTQNLVNTYSDRFSGNIQGSCQNALFYLRDHPWTYPEVNDFYNPILYMVSEYSVGDHVGGGPVEQSPAHLDSYIVDAVNYDCSVPLVGHGNNMISNFGIYPDVAPPIGISDPWNPIDGENPANEEPSEVVVPDYNDDGVIDIFDTDLTLDPEEYMRKYFAFNCMATIDSVKKPQIVKPFEPFSAVIEVTTIGDCNGPMYITSKLAPFLSYAGSPGEMTYRDYVWSDELSVRQSGSPGSNVEILIPPTRARDNERKITYVLHNLVFGHFVPDEYYQIGYVSDAYLYKNTVPISIDGQEYQVHTYDGAVVIDDAFGLGYAGVGQDTWDTIIGVSADNNFVSARLKGTELFNSPNAQCFDPENYQLETGEKWSESGAYGSKYCFLSDGNGNPILNPDGSQKQGMYVALTLCEFGKRMGINDGSCAGGTAKSRSNDPYAIYRGDYTGELGDSYDYISGMDYGVGKYLYEDGMSKIDTAMNNLKKEWGVKIDEIINEIEA